ncbi:MAG TPA: hypothetical protein VMH20_00910 [Verrucomicrobiae bacterium]|nr:hypothetical protein [Verrucomicrobiae bacterium]
MSTFSRGFLGITGSLCICAGGLLPVASLAQTSSKTDQWIHVRVENKEEKGETVRVNVPIEMAVKVLPAINHDKLRDGKVHIDNAHLDDVDLKTLLDAVRTAKDGEYVTVQSNDDNVRVAKNAGYLYIHVTENKGAKHAKDASAKESKVDVKVPMKVVDALFSAGKDELDVVAALRALSGNGDMELVTVKDDQDTVRVWIDSKNISD